MEAAEAIDTLKPLHDALSVLGSAVDADDHELSQALMAHYDGCVQHYLAQHVGELDATALHGLLNRQQRLTVRMAARRDEAAAHLTADRKAVRASLAYLRAESLS
jgi:hypothetical protein